MAPKEVLHHHEKKRNGGVPDRGKKDQKGGRGKNKTCLKERKHLSVVEKQRKLGVHTIWGEGR